MNELERVLIANSAYAPPSNILQQLTDDLVHQSVPGAPHSIYQELWHLAFWQSISLDWIAGIEAPYPVHATVGFPTAADADREAWDQLSQRFLDGAKKAASIAAGDPSVPTPTPKLEQLIRCPSPPGAPTRSMSVREQLESLAAHNAYHLGRIVLLRQLLNAWPPPDGGDTW